MDNQQKCMYVALVGAPNAGKSTLLNRIIGSKVSIVSPKVQTTRTIINGIHTEGDTQLIFYDTPGIFMPHKNRRLEQLIVKAAWRGFDEADVLALLVDAKQGICDNVRLILDKLNATNMRSNAVLILNKIDMVAPETLLTLSQSLHEAYDFSKTFMISALKGDGTHDVLEYFLQQAPLGAWMFAEDQISSAPMRFLAAELVREGLFHRLHRELPYALTVDTEQWKEEDGVVTIHVIIYIERASQKKIVIGKAGKNLKDIGKRARLELEKILEQKVRLYSHVKVKERWVESPDFATSLGLDGE